VNACREYDRRDRSQPDERVLRERVRVDEHRPLVRGDGVGCADEATDPLVVEVPVPEAWNASGSETLSPSTGGGLCAASQTNRACLTSIRLIWYSRARVKLHKGASKIGRAESA
jgi:hypothetical protein